MYKQTIIEYINYIARMCISIGRVGCGRIDRITNERLNAFQKHSPYARLQWQKIIVDQQNRARRGHVNAAQRSGAKSLHFNFSFGFDTKQKKNVFFCSGGAASII